VRSSIDGAAVPEAHLPLEPLDLVADCRRASPSKRLALLSWSRGLPRRPSPRPSAWPSVRRARAALDLWWERISPDGASVKVHPAVGALGEESRHLELSHRPGHRSPEAISAPPRREALDSGGWVV